MTDPPTTTIPLVVTVERNEGGRIERRTFHAFGGTSFDLTDDGPTPLATADLLDEVFRFTRLRDARPGPPTRASFSVSQLEAMKSGAQADLDDAPDPLVEVIRSEPIGYRVTCLHSTEEQTAGGEVTWLDGGDKGLVRIEATDAGVEVTGGSPAEIGREILSYLPARQRD